MRASLASCLCLLVLSGASVAQEKVAPSPHTLADLAWLTGDWRGSDKDEMVSQEVWMAPAGDCMVGMWRLVLEGRLKLSEHMQIVQEATGPVMHLRHFDRSGVGWEDRLQALMLPLVKVGNGEAVFDSGSLRISYKRQPDGSLTVEVVHGDGSPSTYTFRKAS